MDTQTIAPTMFRVEVRPEDGQIDPAADTALREAVDHIQGLTGVKTARVYLVAAPVDDAAVSRISRELLADPIAETATVGTGGPADATIEIHPLPGVMDPVAASARQAICELLPELDPDAVKVRTGRRYDLFFDGVAPADAALEQFAAATLANPVIEKIHLGPVMPDRFPTGHRYELNLTEVPIRDLDDEQLKTLSRDGHLFLSLEEMQTIRDYYQAAGREPTDIELETLAQTWSEHCVHKTLKSTVRYRSDDDNGLDLTGRPGHTVNDDGTVTIDNLLKQTVAAATFELMDEDPEIGNWCVSVFEDNAGIVRFDDQLGVCIKVETHNHPSAIEPYGGAATGIGGCIRDILGTGLVARPIANTNVFAVAYPENADGPLRTDEIPAGVIAPTRILKQVVAGVRDYGNRMGIPTVNGAVFFHPGYLANPLVFAGCVGTIPLDRCFGEPEAGDRIIALGGHTGRDGIHGATFSSAELTDTHADEFSHAVQIGNAITEKKVADVILQARDHADGPLLRAVTDCGAGGFSSAIGEMGEKIGARVHLERAPLKYAGLSYTEIWISEAQERMVLAVPPEKLDRLKALCEAENVSLCDLGTFGHTNDQGEAALQLNYDQTRVGELPMAFLHDGLPMPTREAHWQAITAAPRVPAGGPVEEPTVADTLDRLLAHPEIASKHWIIRQYDHEVQGGSAVKPLVGPAQDGPGDASVVRPRLDSNRAVAIGCGAAPRLADPTLAHDADAYWMALASIDEAVRNVVCTGADPGQIAILDNFCWPGCDDAEAMASLVRAAEGCYDGAKTYRTPFVSGKDSLNTQFTTEDGEKIAIPPTL
ncbi:MAG: phosphoribosylformylglycinamidine synthase subunit PurS, partial [Phycisphaeraceae bacterium]|nr:phosphoribosylformylglycinamidine synthase subunit PurS [Phycisphaeraceae bacterium]